MSGANVSPIGRNKEEWLVQATDYRKLNEPPRPRLQRNGTIYLMARPPPLPRRGLRLSRRLSQTPVSSGRLVGNAQAVMQGGELQLFCNSFTASLARVCTHLA